MKGDGRMSLDLDKRQRAMLRDMGIRVWQPLTPALPAARATDSVPAHAEIAINSVAEHVIPASDKGDLSINKTVATVRAPTAVRPATQPVQANPAPLQPAQPVASAGKELAAWRVGKAQTLYPEAIAEAGARWLVLVEASAAALQADSFHAFEGNAGKLLDNMLRAARLHKAGVALVAPLTRLSASGSSPEGLTAALRALMAEAKPDVVLVMGRLPAQAVLQTNEPLGKLRGRNHSLHGTPTIVTYDATYLLRSQPDKAKAWADLCLCLSLVKSGAPHAA